MEFLSASDPEWSEMWLDLADYPLNLGDPICKNVNTSWEYMGSSEDHHILRHQKHPKTGREEFAYLERKRAAISWAHSA